MNAVVRVFSKLLSWVLGWLVPKDPNLLVVGGRQYGGNTKPIFQEAEKFGMRAIWITKRPEILSLGHERIVSSRSLRGIWVGARASRVVFTHALGDFKPVHFPHPSVRLYNVWHGMPLRRISTMDPDFWARKHAKSDVKEIKRFTGMFVTSPAMAEIFQKTFRLPLEKIHITGQPRTDSLVRGETVSIDNLFEPPLPKGHKKILYCPTWREGIPVKLFPFVDKDIDKLQTELEALNAVIYVRTHPNDPGKWPSRDRRIVPFQGDIAPEVTDTLGHFDVLITDYSSVFYDFLLLDRPTIFLTYDLEEYSRSPGFYWPFEETAVGPHPGTQTDFVRELKHALSAQDEYVIERQQVRKKIYTFLDDGATDRTLAVMRDGV